MAKIKILAAVLALTLLASACGDDGGSTGAAGFGPGGPSGDQNADPTGGAVGDILEDLADGSFDEGDLEDLMENAQDMAESFGGSGSGIVEINGDTITFSSEICIAIQGDFTIEGAGQTGDGTPVWVSISHSVGPRSEAIEFLGEDMVQTIYGDADPIIETEMQVDYGRSEMFGDAGEGMPQYNASTSFAQAQISVEADGNSVAGGGQAQDYSFASGNFEDMYEFTFQASCN